MECISDLLDEKKGFIKLHSVSPQDLIFSTDLSIAYHFYLRSGKSSTLGIHESEESRKWKTIIAGVILDNVWNERKRYGLFALDFDLTVATIMNKGYTAIFFCEDNFYLILRPELCIPLYLLEFTFH